MNEGLDISLSANDGECICIKLHAEGSLFIGSHDHWDGMAVQLNLSEAKQIAEYLNKAIESGELK